MLDDKGWGRQHQGYVCMFMRKKSTSSLPSHTQLLTILHAVMQVDVFAFAVIMQEVFSRIITSSVVVGPTLEPRQAELYAQKVCHFCTDYATVASIYSPESAKCAKMRWQDGLNADVPSNTSH